MATTVSIEPAVATLATAASPWGPVHVVASEVGVAAIERDWSAEAVARRTGERLGGRVEMAGAAMSDPAMAGAAMRDPAMAGAAMSDPAMAGAAMHDPAMAQDGRDRVLRAGLRAVADVIAGNEPSMDLPLDWRGISAWDRRVLEGARTLRRGEVTSYGRLARRIGAPGAARAVGAALGRNPYWLLIPCHRVVAGDGSIGGYGGGPDALDVKRDLLALEGVAVPVASLVD